MAETFVLTCLDKVGGIIGEYLRAPFERQFTYMFCFNTNFKELETQLEVLKRTRESVRLAVDDDRRNVRIVGPDVVAWQIDANTVIGEADGIIADKPRVKEGCLNGWCPNLKLRYSLSRKAVKKTKAVGELQDTGIRYTRSSYSPLPVSMQTLPIGDFTGFESRRLNMEEIIKALTNDEINLIGISGLPGAGKTKMAQEVRTIAKEAKLFDEVGFVAVGQRPDLTKVQNRIADQFGKNNLGKHDDPTTRASLLRERLSQGKNRILLILDDIWKEFDLQDMGIPLEGSNKTFKFLYTSRYKDLWHDEPTKKEIALGVLSAEEAWQLFRDKAGESVDKRELKPIAEEIVKKCGCLPLALVLIGSTLKKRSRGNHVKETWKDMRDRLTRSGTADADEQLSSSVKLSYKYVGKKEAKRLFLLCCLFEEDKYICLEDLARYAMGLSLFDGLNELEEVRCRVFTLVEDLQSSYLLLESEYQYGKYVRESVKVHDVVRDMGISIASERKGALVSHCDVSEWPKKDTYEHYTWISLISKKITELPKGLTCPNLEFLMLDCRKIEKLPCNFFERMGKLKVLEFNNFAGIPTFQSLSNLRTMAFEDYVQPVIDNVSGFRGLCNLEILSFHGSSIKELPEEIGELGNLRLLDLSNTQELNRIRPGVISRLVRLEEIYTVGSCFGDWEGEGAEEGRNANLREFESLSNLNTLQISINSSAFIPRLSIFSKLKKYRVDIRDIHQSSWYDADSLSHDIYKKLFLIWRWTPIPLDRGGFDWFSKNSDFLSLMNPMNNDLVRESLIEGLHQLKRLDINGCDTLEYLANPVNAVQQPEGPTAVVFPILEHLSLCRLQNLREICRNPVPAGSFEKLTYIYVRDCGLLYLFELQIVRSLHQLKELILDRCDMMKEVIWKEHQEDVNATTNRTEFPKLETLRLSGLPSLVGFCKGIDEIDFPHLKSLCLQQISLLSNNSNLSSNSEQNDNVGILSVFPRKVTFPSLEELDLTLLQNVSDILGSKLSAFSFSKLKKLLLCACKSLRTLCNPSIARRLVNLQELSIEDCSKIEAVVDWEQEVEEGQGRKIDKSTLFPQLRYLHLRRLPSLRRFCHTTHPLEMPLLSYMEITKCPNLDAFSLGHGSAPNLSLEGVSCNGDLNNAIKLLHEEERKEQISKLCTSEIGDFAFVKPWIAEEINDKSKIWKLTEISDPSQCRSLKLPGDLRVSTKISRLMYTNSGNGILALAANAIHLFRRGWALGSDARQLWESSADILMTNEFAATNPEDVVPCFTLSNNGLFLIYALGGRITLFSMDRSEKITTFMPPPPAATCLAFHPEDNYFIAIGMDDSTIHIYNVQVDEVKSKLKGHSKRITGLAFSHALSLLVSSGADAQLCLWNSDTWKKKKTTFLEIPGGRTPTTQSDTHVQFHPDQTHFLVVHETQLSIYEATKLECVKQWIPSEPTPITHAMFSCDGQLVYASFLNGSVCVFIASNFRMWCRINPSTYLSLSVSNSNVQALVIAAHPEKPNQFAVGLSDGGVHVFEPLESEGKWGVLPLDAISAAAAAAATTTSAGLADRVASVVASSRMNGNAEEINDKSKIRKLIEISNPSQCRSLKLPGHLRVSTKISRLMYTNSGDGILALAANAIHLFWRWRRPDRHSRVWATTSVPPQFWQPSSDILMTNEFAVANPEDAVPCFALSNDGIDVMSASGGRISVFNMWTFETMRTFMPPPPPAATFLAFHPRDNNIVAIGMDDSTIQIYNVGVSEVKSKLKGHSKRITGLAFSGDFLVSSGADAQLCLWNSDTWEKQKATFLHIPGGRTPPTQSDTRVQRQPGSSYFLVVHETQLSFYEKTKLECVKQWIRRESAPITDAMSSWNGDLVYASFLDGSVCVFGRNLQMQCRISPSAYLSPSVSNSNVQALVIAAHPYKPNQFAIGLSDGGVHVLEPLESEGEWGVLPPNENESASSAAAAPDIQIMRNEEEEEEKKESEDVDKDEEDQEEESSTSLRRRRRQ